MNEETPAFMSLFDPYLYHTLHEQIGATVVVQTTKGTVTGKLENVMPDFVVVESGGSPFFIRIQQIVWVIPKS